ncbi:bifunctional molybdenum cofactor biosynthesis protein MoaC/MoaB [Microbacterium oxydans]|nr:bifunctional molybdenum cofactor biosynthesis protein MoaC/MoaB [Microbacterium oxydans]
MNELPHLDDHGRSRMIDIGGKAITRRTAIATGRLDTTPAVLELLAANQLRKADALPTARVAGIQGAKRTSELVPLAHTLPLESVTVDFELSTSSVEIRATVAATAKTGAEMEALTAVAIAGLALHDMIKSVDPAAVLGDIHLIEKTGGKRGHWVAGASVPADHGQAVVIVSSTSTAAGTREDLTGPAIAGWLRDHGYQPDEPVVVADADIYQALTDALTSEPVLIVTTGGTGVHPEDRTPRGDERGDRESTSRHRRGHPCSGPRGDADSLAQQGACRDRRTHDRHQPAWIATRRGRRPHRTGAALATPARPAGRRRTCLTRSVSSPLLRWTRRSWKHGYAVGRTGRWSPSKASCATMITERTSALSTTRRTPTRNESSSTCARGSLKPRTAMSSPLTASVTSRSATSHWSRSSPPRTGQRRSPSAGTSSTRSRQRFRSGSTSTSPTADRSGWGCRYTARPSEPAG